MVLVTRPRFSVVLCVFPMHRLICFSQKPRDEQERVKKKKIPRTIPYPSSPLGTRFIYGLLRVFYVEQAGLEFVCS